MGSWQVFKKYIHFFLVFLPLQERRRILLCCQFLLPGVKIYVQYNVLIKLSYVSWIVLLSSFNEEYTFPELPWGLLGKSSQDYLRATFKVSTMCQALGTAKWLKDMFHSQCPGGNSMQINNHKWYATHKVQDFGSAGKGGVFPSFTHLLSASYGLHKEWCSGEKH